MHLSPLGPDDALPSTFGLSIYYDHAQANHLEPLPVDLVTVDLTMHYNGSGGDDDSELRTITEPMKQAIKEKLPDFELRTPAYFVVMRSYGTYPKAYLQYARRAAVPPSRAEAAARRATLVRLCAPETLLGATQAFFRGTKGRCMAYSPPKQDRSYYEREVHKTLIELGVAVAAQSARPTAPSPSRVPEAPRVARTRAAHRAACGVGTCD